jgi:excisionase family DNA binding protein
MLWYVMVQDVYSVEDVAALLGLHPRTVRSYVRSGRLPAARIGKQYRIARADLEVFMGRPVTVPDRIRRERHVDVTSVVDVDAISPESANRISTMLMASVKTRDRSDQSLRVETVYDAERGRLKIMVLGGAQTTIVLLKVIAALAEAES